jgi:hypothetical protein
MSDPADPRCTACDHLRSEHDRPNDRCRLCGCWPFGEPISDPSTPTDRPLTGRELNEQHAALVAAGMDPLWTLRWLRRETDLWIIRS